MKPKHSTCTLLHFWNWTVKCFLGAETLEHAGTVHQGFKRSTK